VKLGFGVGVPRFITLHIPVFKRNMRQYTTTVGPLLLRRNLLWMGLILDYPIPTIHVAIYLVPYMARALAAKALEKDLGRVGTTKERTNVAETHVTTGAFLTAQKMQPVRRRGILRAGLPQKVGINPLLCARTCGFSRFLLQKRCATDSFEQTQSTSIT
jgi:hypothetical protein